MATLNGEQVLENDIRCLGEDLGRLYNAIKNEYYRLKIKWKEYKTLFGSSQEQIDLLNKVAPFFFSQIQHLMFNDIVLHINRMNYEKKRGKYEYLSVRGMPDLETKLERKQILQTLVDESVRVSRFSEDQRNRYIAHRSLDLFTNPNAKPLEGINDQEVETALLALWKIVEYVELEYHGTSTIDDIFYPLGSALALVTRLKRTTDS